MKRAVSTAGHFRDDWRPVTATPMRLDPAIQPGRSSLAPNVIASTNFEFRP